MLTLTRVGTQQEAETAVVLFEESDFRCSTDAYDIDSEPMRDGWEILCTGTNRLCFLSPDKKTVYKIQYIDEDRSNATEWYHYKRLISKRWSTFRIAHCSFYETATKSVIAMEYVLGDYSKNDDANRFISNETGVSDIWFKNILQPYDGSVPVLIDMGE